MFVFENDVILTEKAKILCDMPLEGTKTVIVSLRNVKPFFNKELQDAYQFVKDALISDEHRAIDVLFKAGILVWSSGEIKEGKQDILYWHLVNLVGKVPFTYNDAQTSEMKILMEAIFRLAYAFGVDVTCGGEFDISKLKPDQVFENGLFAVNKYVLGMFAHPGVFPELLKHNILITEYSTYFNIRLQKQEAVQVVNPEVFTVSYHGKSITLTFEEFNALLAAALQKRDTVKNDCFLSLPSVNIENKENAIREVTRICDTFTVVNVLGTALKKIQLLVVAQDNLNGKNN